MPRKILALLLTLALLWPAAPALAQTETPPSGPIYIVQQGDTLWDIAVRFGVSLSELQAANGGASQNIFVGDRLVIPGLEELSGTLVIQPVPFGETLRSLSRQYRLDPALLRKLNHIASPTELYAGYRLIVLQQEDQPSWNARAELAPGETLLELAVRQGSAPWAIARINALSGPSASLPGDVLYLPSGDSSAAPTGLPASIVAAEITPLPITQGQTVQIKVTTTTPVSLGGLLVDRPLQFFPLEDDTQVALQGVHAMTPPGLYPLRLDVTQPDGSLQSFEQMVLVTDGYFIQDPVLIVDQLTIDPAVTEPESEQVQSITAHVTSEKLWQGRFQLPVDDQYCLRSLYGNRRSYNNSDFIYYHTGLDFGICSETRPFDLYAPADGVVVFAGPLTVRGNATIVDHGWGVFSGFWHQEEIYVAVGDQVTPGQLIGKIGATGRVTGAHLHWEVWVNGIQVNPLQWLDETFPH